jgi:hypothetical protein
VAEDLTHVVMNQDDTDLSKETLETLGQYLKDLTAYVEGEAHPAGNPQGNVTQLPKVPDPFLPNMSFEFGVADQDPLSFDFNIEIPAVGETQKPPTPENVVINKTTRVSKNKNALRNDIKAVGGYRGVGDTGQALAGDKSMMTPADAGLAQKNASAILRYNRFNPHDTTPFLRDGATEPALYRNQGSLGAYSAKVDTQHPEIGISELQDLAVKMMLYATGHPKEGVDEVDALMLPGSGFSFAQAAFPGVEPDMIDVNPLKRAEDLDLFGPNGKFEIPFSELTPDEVKTWGQLNSPNEPFSGPFPGGMILLAALMIIMLLLIAIFIQWVTDACTPGAGWGGSSAGTKNKGTLGVIEVSGPTAATTWHGFMGEHAPRDKDADWSSGMGNKFMEMFGIPFTRHGFHACFPVGLESFYGFASGGLSSLMAGAGGFVPDFNQLFDMLENIIVGSGYYSVIMRAVARDMTQIKDAFAAMGSAGSFVAGMAGVFGILESLTTSITWRFIMTMASVGDRILDDKFQTFNPARLGNPLKTVNEADPIALNRLKKSRYSNQDSQLVWSSRSAMSLYLLPQKLQQALKTAKDNTLEGHGMLALTTPWTTISATEASEEGLAATNTTAQRGSYYAKHNQLNAGIIAPEVVEKVEAMLEAEFCPFYFHDLRTNELITFHAFITSLTESFAPSWSALEAYGRMDDVMILQKTTRTLTLSFVVAATSPSDMGSMYYKLNKLIAMVYPQWSDGKLMQVGKRKFRMPFSQIPTASPVIRMRIGDLVSSNYSRFGLARLFGIGDTSFTPSFQEAAGNPSPSGDGDASQQQEQSEDTQDAAASNSASDAAALEEASGEIGENVMLVLTKGATEVPVFEKKDPLVNGGATFAASPGGNGHIIIKDGTKVTVVKTMPQDPAGTPAAAGSDNNEPAEAGSQDASAEQTPAADSTPASDVIPPTGRRYLVIVNDPKYDATGGSPKSDAAGVQYKVHVGHGTKITTGIKRAPEQVAADIAEVTNAGATEETAPEQEPSAIKLFFAGSEADATSQNPIVRSFEATRGSGLAGVITSLNFTHTDSPWGGEAGSVKANSPDKAPIWVMCDLGFTVIHDITPGLAADGSLRAPTWPVGEFIAQTHGRPYGTKHYAEEQAVATAQSAATNASPEDNAAAEGDATDAASAEPEGATGAAGQAAVGGSDRRLKMEIVLVGQSPSGISIYEFSYRADPLARWRGVMAQDILDDHPDAVIVDENGYYAVRYDKIDVEFERVL